MLFLNWLPYRNTSGIPRTRRRLWHILRIDTIRGKSRQPTEEIRLKSIILGGIVSGVFARYDFSDCVLESRECWWDGRRWCCCCLPCLTTSLTTRSCYVTNDVSILIEYGRPRILRGKLSHKAKETNNNPRAMNALLQFLKVTNGGRIRQTNLLWYRQTTCKGWRATLIAKL